MQGIKSTGFDQGFHRALVQATAVYSHTEVKQAGEGSTLLARFDDGIDGLLSCAFDGAQTVPNDFVGHRFKAVRAAIDIGRIKAHAKLQGIFKQHFQFVGVVHFDGHVGAEKLCGEMHLEPTRVIRQQRISSRVRFIETVARKLFHQVKNFVGFDFRQTVGLSALAENGAMLGHLFGFFLTHGAAQQIGTAQAVAAQHLRGLHHLLLVNHDAVGFGQHFFYQGVWVLHHFAAMLARHKAGNQIHRAWTVQGIECNQVFQA